MADDQNVTKLRPRRVDRTATRRQQRRRAKLKNLVTPVTTVTTAQRNVTRGLALAAAIALSAMSAYFGTVGMAAIFAAAVTPITIMTGVLEAAKLVTAAWLTRHWRTAPWLLRAPLVTMVLALMTLSAAGTFGFLSRAHLTRQVEATEVIERDAAPLAQRVALAESAVADLDGRILQLDEIVRAATARAHTRTAMQLVGDQAQRRAALVVQRGRAASALADLKVEQAAIVARRARVAGESGPALYLARLFGSDDSENVVRLITALLVFVLDPLAILLVLAASSRTRS